MGVSLNLVAVAAGVPDKTNGTSCGSFPECL